MDQSSTAGGFDISELAWRRASRCSNSGCVEVLITEHWVVVRDSKRLPDLSALIFDHEEWQAFLDGVKAGEFDLLSIAELHSMPTRPLPEPVQ